MNYLFNFIKLNTIQLINSNYNSQHLKKEMLTNSFYNIFFILKISLTIIKHFIFIILTIILLSLPIYALDNKNNRYYFENINTPFSSYDEYLQLKEKNNDIFKIKMGLLYFQKGSYIFATLTSQFEDKSENKKHPQDPRLEEITNVKDSEINAKTGYKYIKKALDIFKKLWKKKKTDPLLNFLYARSLMTFLGYNYNFKLEKIDLMTLSNDFMKSRTLINLAIMKLPENIDLRFFRVSITYNIPKNSGMRPDSQILKDTDKFIENYNRLPEKEKEDRIFQLNLIYLIKSFILSENNKIQEAKIFLLKVSPDKLKVKMYKDLYNELKKKLKIK